MQPQSPDLKESAVFRTIVSVVLQQSPQSVRWLLVHIPRCLLEDPRAVVVLRNDTVENLAHRCVPHRPRPNSHNRRSIGRLITTMVFFGVATNEGARSNALTVEAMACISLPITCNSMRCYAVYGLNPECPCSWRKWGVGVEQVAAITG